jgi:hypothetical protein
MAAQLIVERKAELLIADKFTMHLLCEAELGRISSVHFCNSSLLFTVWQASLASCARSFRL